MIQDWVNTLKLFPLAAISQGRFSSECSEEFLDILNNADLVISKGQGNYEALSDCGRKIFFLLKAKCPVISEKLNVSLNDYVFKYHEESLEKRS